MSFLPVLPRINETHQHSGCVSWICPSNIALVKYWGKRPVQLPANPSISFTLNKAHTETIVQYSPRDIHKPWVRFSFEGHEEIAFADRIIKYFSSIKNDIPWVDQLSFDIQSKNSFPHSSGIASSASSMGTLALSLCDIEQSLFDIEDQSLFYKKASYLSRLGSGSACRSLYPHLAAWGSVDILKDSSDLYAVPITGYDSVFKNFHDDILIVSDKKKSVSSSEGHNLMNTHVFANVRYKQARHHFDGIIDALKNGDLMTFGKIVEDEALTLHALMMCSDPSYILLEPATVEAIKRIRDFRKSSGVPIFFTLDAGPNVHILYPDDCREEVSNFIHHQLLSLAHHGRIIRDMVGQGPKKVR